MVTLTRLRVCAARLLAAASLACAGLSAPAASGEEPSARPESHVDRGEAIAIVSQAADGDGVHVTAAVEIALPAAEVWPVMTSCDRAPTFVPGLVSCRILERDPSGAWDIREHVSSPGWLLPNVRTVFRSEYVPNQRVSFARVAGDLSRSEGEWRLTELNGGNSTRVSYVADVNYDTMLPGFMLRSHLQDQMVRVLSALRRECMRREKR